MNKDGDKETSEGVIRKFDKCPGCGSMERYFEGILKEAQDKGLIDKTATHFDFQRQQGVVLPPQKLALLPLGAEIPGFNRIWDTCCDCGMVYSTYLEKATAKKSINLAPSQAMPNRAERRRMERGGFFNSNINNSQLS